MREALERTADAAHTAVELFAAYRRAVADVSEAAQNAAAAGQDRNLRRSVDYIQQHYTESLRLEKVASVAGFTPTYFSKLFRRREKVSFAKYVAGLRIERAKQLLAGTEIDATRIAQMSGFRSPQYFCDVFRRATGATPLEWRQRPDRLSAAGRTRIRKLKR
jgi:YesN/AraC family two-component response regulator